MADLVEIATTPEGKPEAVLHLHPGQRRAWDSAARFVFMIAGSQGGKTSFGPWWLRREIQRCGPGDYLAATSSYDLFKLKMLPEMQRVFCRLCAFDGWLWQASDRVIASDKLKSRIILRSAQAEGGLESATALAAWLDECGQDDFRLDSWEAVQRRLALAQGRVLGTTTPYNLGWLKREVVDRWLNGDATFEVIQFSSTENPRYPREEYDRLKATMAAWKAAMFLDGQFSRPAGLIYGDFSDAENVVEDFEIPKDWARYVGIDFGGVHQASVWLAKHPAHGDYYLYRETLEGGLTTGEHAKRATARGERVLRWSGGAKSEEQQRRDWRAAGVWVQEPQVSDVEAGIDRVIALVKPRRLRIFRSCRGILDELGTYSRELDQAGQPTEKIRDKNTYHRLDALRYIAGDLEGASGAMAAPKANERSEVEVLGWDEMEAM